MVMRGLVQSRCVDGEAIRGVVRHARRQSSSGCCCSLQEGVEIVVCVLGRLVMGAKRLCK